MRTSFQTLLVTLSLLTGVIHVHAQGTSFTYQGRFTDNGAPYTGNVEIQATLWDAVSGGSQSAANVPPQVVVGVTNGLFVLPLNFGANFPGANRWLKLEVRTSIGAFTPLTPRQPLTPTPYAITAGNLNGPVPSGNLAGTYSSALTLNNAANSFSGSGAGLTALDAGQLTSGAVPDARLGANVARTNQVWLLSGNTGTTPGTHFLGTTGNQPLEFKVNGMRALRLEPNASGAPNVIGGSPNNFAGAGIVGATIGGGGALNYFGLSYTNRVEGNFGTVSGGKHNAIQTNALGATIGGGEQNKIQTNSSYATIGGGIFITIQPNAFYATIGGGSQNTIQSDSGHATIGGGHRNTNQLNANYATIGGGYENTIQANAHSATIGGGGLNTIQSDAYYATIPGGFQNSAASWSFAAGYRAKANHIGTFVWSDTQASDFASTSFNQFCIRANGGVQLNGDTPMFFGSTLSQKINLYGNTFAIGIQNSVQYSRVGAGCGFGWYAGGVHNDNTFNSGGGTTLMTLTGGGLVVNGLFVHASDRNLKENFAPVQPREMLEKVLALSLSSWNLKADPATRHIGPMAQDFYAAFNLGADDKHIATVDADGVALAAIQGLNEKLEAGGRRSEVRSQRSEVRIQKLEAENAELKRRLEAMEKIIWSQSSD